MNIRPLVRLVQRVLPQKLHPIGAGVYWWGLKYHCPVCGWSARAFRPLAANPNCPERCSRCGSLARHRLIWLFLQQRTDFFSEPHKVLHVSPEACFIERFRKQPNLDYITADLAGGYATWTEVMDITAIDKPDNTYDVILCIHVLQAVEDDRKAISELYRVLKPGGWAILNSRIDSNATETRPHPALPSPEIRAKAAHRDFAFRIYGGDFARRLGEPGFVVDVIPFRDSLSAKVISREFLQTPSEIYLCRKPATPGG